MRREVKFVLAYGVAAVVVVTKLLGCSPAVPTAADQSKVAAYGAALGVCLEQSKTRAEYDSCACKVDQQFGRTDAGWCS